MSMIHARGHASRFVLGAAVALSFVATCGSARAAVLVTGQNGVTASVYANPFDPDNDGVTSGAEATSITFGAIGGGSVSPQFALENIVNRTDSRDVPGIGALQGSASKGFMQFTAANAFTVGTVIGDQWLSSIYGTLANPDMAYDVKVGGTTVQSGPGLPDTHDLKVSTVTNPITTNQLRIEIDMAEYSGTNYGNFSEVTLLPDALARIAATTTASSGTASFLYDLNGAGTSAGGGVDGGWVGNDATPDFTLTFAAATSVNALVLATWENAVIAPSSFTISDDTNTIIATVSMAAGDYGSIRFDTPVITSSLRFDFATTPVGMREVIALTAIPEPSSLMALAAGGALLLRRRTK